MSLSIAFSYNIVYNHIYLEIYEKRTIGQKNKAFKRDSS